jgi:hypothetical protein
LDAGAPPFKKVMRCRVEQHARLSSSVLHRTATRLCKLQAVPAGGIGRRPLVARYARSCTEPQRRFSIPSSRPVSVSSDTPFEKGASRCSPGTSQRAAKRYAKMRCATTNSAMFRTLSWHHLAPARIRECEAASWRPGCPPELAQSAGKRYIRSAVSEEVRHLGPKGWVHRCQNGARDFGRYI